MKTFYDYIRKPLFNGSITQSQVNGIQRIVDTCIANKITDRRWVAYMLATCYHETAKTMKPIVEYGKGKGKDYGKKLKMGKGPGKRVGYKNPEQLYYGRGDVQLTWYENYEKMGKLLNVDLLNNPELALDPVISCRIMIEGMTKSKSSFGDFTGKCLEQFFNATTTDWINARKIINGLDCANDIAAYAKIFYAALKTLEDGKD
jgi:putative chitinase